MKRPTKYRRCKKCRELVLDPERCENCANRDPNRWGRGYYYTGKRGAPTLDMIEENSGMWGDDK